ncbi:hypothetical protein JXR93_01480 [bacterium]|nr:hypothetical protein [bacterium]
MNELLFENPLYLIILFLGGSVFLYSKWKGSLLENSRFWKMLIPTAIAGVIFLISHFVVTDKEAILNASNKISSEISLNNYSILKKMLKSDFTISYKSQIINKDEFLKFLDELQSEQKYIITRMSIKLNQLRIMSSKATTDFNITIYIDTSEGIFRQILNWKLYWEKDGNHWLISKSDEPKPLLF